MCPNCHTQTPSYAGANNSKNKFAERLPLLLNYKIIKREHLIEFSKVWNLSIDTIKHWIIKNENKLNIYNIQIAELNKVYNQKKDSISKSTEKMNRLNDLKSIDEIGSMLENLSKKWNISKNNIKPWLKRNATDYYNQIEEYLRNKKVEVKIKIIPQEKIDLTYRFNEVYQLTNKKQVPQLARKWRVSDTGAKKWIRNNMPEKFKEIYDDSLLEKNKKLALKNDKANYIKSLNLDTFDLENIMIELKTNKSGLYSLIKNKNPTLYEQLTNHIHCKFCNGKVRTSGFNKDEQPRYRCVSEECGKSFMIA